MPWPRLMALLALGLTLAGAGRARASDRGAFQPLGVVVVDALDQPLGPVVAPGANAARVLLRVDRRTAIVLVDRSRFHGEMGVSILYESTDCTGPAWVEDFFPDQPGLRIPAAIGAGNVLMAASGPAEDRQVQSSWSPFLDPPGCNGPFGPSTAKVFPAEPLLALDTFVPPFRPQARPRATAGSSGRDAFGPAVVVDAGGTPIGSLLGPDGSDAVGVLVDISGRLTTLAVTGNRFYSAGAVGYKDPGCTGDIHVIGPGGGSTPLFDLVAVGPDSILFGVTGPLQPTQLGSRWNNNTPTPGCLDGLFTQDAAPAVPIGDLGLFAPPFGAR